ncbi:MAG: HAMP domain-containing sensor histidine kinase [Clostridia bacterium]
MKRITKKLVIGISAIVLFLSVVIGFFFLTQYRDILLEERKNELDNSARQIATVAASNSGVNNYNDIMQNAEAVEILSTVTDTKIWMLTLENNKLIVNSGLKDTENIKNKIQRDVDKLLKSKEMSIVSFVYSGHFNNKQMTLIRKITKGNNVVGVVFLHKNIDDIYVKYDNLAQSVSATIVIGMLLSIVLGVIYSYRFTKPIDKMTQIAKDISKGNYGRKTGIEQDDEIGELALALDNMSVELEKYIKDIKRLELSAKELVANVSHEFKTPLTLIRGYVENLQDGTVEPSDEVYNKIIRNTKLLERLVNEVLDLSKYQTGKVILKKELLDLNQLVGDLVNDMTQIAINKDINLIFKNENRDPNIFEIDYLKLKQVLTIFMDNAIKYSEKGSNVEVILENSTITIKDHGIGMSKEQVDHIYDRFYQVDPQKNGNGLGMCIAKYIIDLHKFDVTIESEIGKGTNIKLKV